MKYCLFFEVFALIGGVGIGFFSAKAIEESRSREVSRTVIVGDDIVSQVNCFAIGGGDWNGGDSRWERKGWKAQFKAVGGKGVDLDIDFDSPCDLAKFKAGKDYKITVRLEAAE